MNPIKIWSLNSCITKSTVCLFCNVLSSNCILEIISVCSIEVLTAAIMIAVSCDIIEVTDRFRGTYRLIFLQASFLLDLFIDSGVNVVLLNVCWLSAGYTPFQSRWGSNRDITGSGERWRPATVKSLVIQHLRTDQCESCPIHLVQLSSLSSVSYDSYLW